MEQKPGCREISNSATASISSPMLFPPTIRKGSANIEESKTPLIDDRRTSFVYDQNPKKTEGSAGKSSLKNNSSALKEFRIRKTQSRKSPLGSTSS